MPLYTVPTTAVYVDTATGDSRSYTQGAQIDMTDAVRFGMAGATSLAAVGASLNAQTAVRTVTATTDGLGNGTIPAGTDFVTVASDDANKIVVLPNAPVGASIALSNGATGYELRTHEPTTNGINGGVGVNAESAIPASVIVVFRRATATNWIRASRTSAGTLSVTQVAAP